MDRPLAPAPVARIAFRSRAFAISVCLLTFGLAAAGFAAGLPPGVTGEEWMRAHPRTPAEALALVKRARAARAAEARARGLDPERARVPVARPAGATEMDGVWQQWAPPTGAGHALVYDSRRDRLVALGGNGNSPPGDLWTMPLDGLPHWTRLTALGALPAGHVAAAYDSAEDRVIAVVSVDAAGTTHSDVWALALSGTPAWSHVGTSGPMPAGHYRSQLAWDAGNRRVFLVLPGPDEIWRLDLLPIPTWSLVTADGVDPGAYFFGGLAWDARRGRLLALTSDGTWALDEATLSWSLVESYQIDGGSFYTTNPGDHLLIDPVGDALFTLQYAGGAVRTPLGGGPTTQTADGMRGRRTGMGSAYDSHRGRAIVNAGWDEYTFVDNSSTVALDLATATDWIDIGLQSGGARMWHQSVIDPARDRIVTYGGFAYPPRADSLIARPLSDPTAGVTVLHAAGSGPSAYYGFSWTLDPPRDRVLLYGGDPLPLRPTLDQLWSLSLSDPPAWTELTPAGPSPGPRSFHTMLYDRVRDRMLLMGGYDATGAVPGVWELTFTPELRWRPLVGAGDDDGTHAAFSFADGAGGAWVWSALIYPGFIWHVSIGADTVRFTTVPEVGRPPLEWYEFDPAGYDATRHRLVVFGQKVDVDDLSGWWAVDLGSTATWSWHAVGGPYPYNRDLYSMVFDTTHDRLVIYAGYDEGEEYLDDTWSLDWAQPTPVLASLVSAEVRDGRAHVQWQLSGFSGAPVGVQRAVASGAWATIAARAPDGAGRVEFDEPLAGSGTRVGYRLLVRDAGGDAPVGETWLEVPAGPAFALGGATRNPVVDDLDVAFSLDRAARVSLALYDIGGRRVLARELSAGAGAHRERLAARGELKAGVYFMRLSDGARSVTARAVVVR